MGSLTVIKKKRFDEVGASEDAKRDYYRDQAQKDDADNKGWSLQRRVIRKIDLSEKIRICSCWHKPSSGHFFGFCGGGMWRKGGVASQKGLTDTKEC